MEKELGMGVLLPASLRLQEAVSGGGKLAGGAAPPCCKAAWQLLEYQCCCVLLLPRPRCLLLSQPSDRSRPEAKAWCPQELLEPPQGLVSAWPCKALTKPR